MANIREISPELAAKARDELHEVTARIPEDISTLRLWIEKQPHLKARTDDQFLIAFLRGGKYSLEKAKQKIDFFFTIKSLSPELFLSKQIDDKAVHLARLGVFVPLPKPLGPDGPRLHVTRYGPINPNDFSLAELSKHQLRIFDMEMQDDDNSVIAGVINIADMSAMSLGFLMQFDPVLIKKIGVFSDKALPLRIKGVHLVNVPKEAATLLNIVRGLMSKKLVDRMKIHSSMDSLYEDVPKEYLPEDYGGTNGRLDDLGAEWEKRMIAYTKFFEEDKDYGVNEKLRVGTKYSSESLFGLEGSFRKLEVD